MDKTVYILDDNQDVVNINEMFLVEAGFKVVGKSTSSKNALDEILNLTPSYLCLDIIMPDRDGIEVFRSLQENSSPTEVFFVSALSSEKKFVHHLSQEIEEFRFLEKPLTSEALDSFLLNITAKTKELPQLNLNEEEAS